MSEMTLNESIERFEQGLRKASSRARQLSKIQGSKSWEQIAINLDQLRQKGRLMYSQKGLTRQETLILADRISANMKVQ